MAATVEAVDGSTVLKLRDSMLGLATDTGRRPRERVAAARVLVAVGRLCLEVDRLWAELAVAKPPGGGGEGAAPEPDSAPDHVVSVGEVS